MKKPPKRVRTVKRTDVPTQDHTPESPDASIGHVLEETHRGRMRSGKAIAWEYTERTIYNIKTKQRWPGFRFCMRSNDGKLWWSQSYPDRRKPK